MPQLVPRTGRRSRWSIAGWAGLFMSASLGVLLGTGGFTFYVARGGSYLSSDPLACVNCHIMREPYNGWQKSSHHAVAVCNDCHVSQHPVGKWITKADNGWRHSWAFTFQDFHEPIQLHERGRAVLQNNCLRCHSELVAELTQHAHMERDKSSCLDCHSTVGHGGGH